MKLAKYEYLEKEELELQYGVKGVVEKRKEDFAEKYRNGIVIGVVLCIAAVIPLILAAAFGANDLVALVFMCLLLCMISLAVYIFVGRGLVQESFSKLLQEGDYTPEHKRGGRIVEKIAGVYWCIVTAIYLLWSFLTNDWGKTWLVWPVAGVLFGGIVCATHVVAKKK